MRGFLTGPILAVALALSPCAFAQDDAPSSSPPASEAEAQPSDAPTPDGGEAAASGSKPDDSGSTGWTGGTGGSFIGEDHEVDAEVGPYKQPEVASGLNPFE
jgi:hypothetical protein